MSPKVRVIGGFIEIDYERVAQILPSADERAVSDELSGVSRDIVESEISDAYEDAKAEAEHEYDQRLADFNERIDRFLERLLKEGVITDAQHDKICEGFPCE